MIHGLIRGAILFSGLTTLGTIHGLGGIELIVPIIIHLTPSMVITTTKGCIEIMPEEVRYTNTTVIQAVREIEMVLTTEIHTQEVEGSQVLMLIRDQHVVLEVPLVLQIDQALMTTVRVLNPDGQMKGRVEVHTIAQVLQEETEVHITEEMTDARRVQVVAQERVPKLWGET